MADVSISYKGNEIASMNATGVKTLLTGSSFCEDDITVSYTKPSGGTDTSDATMTSGDQMLSGVTAYSQGTKYTGTIAAKTSSDLTASGDTVTVPAGHYASPATKAVASGSATTPATTITANPSISVSSGGLITASVSASKSVTPTVSAGYVSSGTSGTVSVSGSNTSQLTAQAAQTIHPSTSDQTIASGKYLTGAQTVLGVLLSNLSAGNIKKDVVVKVGDSTDDDCVTSVTGTYEGGGGGASNIRQGTFTTGSTGATTATFDTGYTGSGYPIAMFIYVDGGPYNNSSTYGGNTTWYNSKVRYDCGFYAMVKSIVPQAPSYSNDAATVAMIYKNSTSNATTYTRTSAMSVSTYASSSSVANPSTACARFKGDSKTVSYYVGNGTSDTIGFPKSTKMAYIVIYSS